MKVVDAVRNGNNDVGGRLVELSGTEYMVRGRGYAKSVDDIGNIVLLSTESGVPVRVKDVGNVVLGPDIRRGIADWNGEGDVVSGIVVMRQGENALDVIGRVIGCRYLVVDPKEDATKFYEGFGFKYLKKSNQRTAPGMPGALRRWLLSG